MLAKIRELYEYRDLLGTLTIKELKVQYRSSVLGFFWSLLNPLLMMLIFSFVFAYVFRFGIKDFPVFFLCGLLPWNFFNIAVTVATGSVVANGNLVKKVYFPREILPLSVVFANFINFLLSLIVLFVFLIYYGYNFWTYLPVLVLAIFVELVLTAGLALFLAGINVFFRDIQYIVTVFLMALFYATPIIYNLERVEKTYWMTHYPWLMIIYKLNPLVPVITLYRDALYSHVMPSLNIFMFAIFTPIAFLVLGFYVFHKLEPKFAEEV